MARYQLCIIIIIINAKRLFCYNTDITQNECYNEVLV